MTAFLELLRKGRFDKIFFVGLSTARERQIILNIHIEGTRDVKNFEKQMAGAGCGQRRIQRR